MWYRAGQGQRQETASGNQVKVSLRDEDNHFLLDCDSSFIVSIPFVLRTPLHGLPQGCFPIIEFWFSSSASAVAKENIRKMSLWCKIALIRIGRFGVGPN
ncbi:MAG: hypothetical protein EHM72_16885 [Calditrichaeota bacterium]|nr:MAG: hypothetical protein EHM72_16885 [Calditrichota bacterium]